MSQQPMVSVIVPVYKVEKYLSECIESILNQTYVDFELILVDDGSPDRCGEICDEYAWKDSRVKVIHKENGGVSRARNTGIHAAQGKYIMFVDSDDYIERNSIEIMMGSCGEEIDMVSSSIRYVYPDSTRNKDCPLPDVCLKIPGELNGSYEQIANNFGFSAIYSKLYKREILLKKEIFFATDFSILEDGTFVYSYLKECRRCAFFKDVLYNYRQSEDESLMKRFNKNADMALKEYYNRSKWVKEILDEQNKKQFDYRIASLFLSFALQIYRRSALGFSEKYRLLKRYAAAGKTVVCDYILNRFSVKHRLLLHLLLSNNTAAAHFLLSLNEII